MLQKLNKTENIAFEVKQIYLQLLLSCRLFTYLLYNIVDCRHVTAVIKLKSMHSVFCLY